MPTSFLEIVELPDGRIELRRAEDEGSLVTLDFSEDAKVFLQGQHVEVAKAMLSVGVQMAGRLAEGEPEKTTDRGFFTESRGERALVASPITTGQACDFIPIEYSNSAHPLCVQH